jgi:hypothetical protein
MFFSLIGWKIGDIQGYSVTHSVSRGGFEMAHKKVLFGSAAREKVLQGAGALTDVPEPEKDGMGQSPQI